MDRKELAKRLVKLAQQIAKEEPEITQEDADAKLGQALVASFADREWLSAEDVEVFCPKCASKMREKKISKIKKDKLFTAYKHLPWDECIAKAKAWGADDPAAVCGHIKWHVSPKYKK
jgi:hypothetical protein